MSKLVNENMTLSWICMSHAVHGLFVFANEVVIPPVSYLQRFREPCVSSCCILVGRWTLDLMVVH